MQLIIRDDYINYVPTPDMVGSLYGRLLESKTRIRFKENPAQRINVNGLYQEKVPVYNISLLGIYFIFLKPILYVSSQFRQTRS